MTDMSMEGNGGGPPHKQVETVDTVAIRFSGDSGDGMQLTGTRFTSATAIAGNDLSTLPDFPAEIRAPAGTLAGVSGFQINFSSRDVHTPGDSPDVLVAMNPAALKANLGDLKRGGMIILNTSAFNQKAYDKAGYKSDPLTDGTLNGYRVFQVDVTKMTQAALRDLGLQPSVMDRSKNFFALGLMFWMYQRPMENTVAWIEARFKNQPEIMEANLRALHAGYHFGENTEIFQTTYVVREAHLPPGTYCNITGNEAVARGFVAAAKLAGLRLLYGSYPITPASDVLHELSRYKNYDVVTVQAEDEIAAVSAAIGAAFGGALGVTGTSGPGMALKAEAMNLAVMTELPVVVLDVQRGGPSTGLPTKTEQADLLQALYGRNSDSPVPVVAARSAGDCFYVAIEAARIAVKYMTPVILLTDGYLANGSEPWKIPSVEDLPKIEVKFRTDPQGFFPYLRDPETLARPWVKPGTPGLEHRIGGIEKQDVTGNVSYDPANHEHMVRTRAAKVAGIAKDIPSAEVEGPPRGKLLVIAWGSTYGAITTAVGALQARGASVSHVHLRHLNPLPRNLGEIISSFERVLVPEMNMGQLVKVIRAEYLVDAIGLNKIQGQPFKISEIMDKIEEVLAS
ncbi:MAG: 2-oxoacid:acceptor oxidoreductase subunit alpha [Candidatus Tectomicrobia bacterium]|nr:2-oxoacid:acceptor oxidoreductase subunit alpha [Candidatus Tectomicrobia bacterium]